MLSLGRNLRGLVYSFLLFFITQLNFTLPAQEVPRIFLGVDNFLSHPPEEVLGKRLGLITNPTGITTRLRSTVDALYNDKRFQLVALFGPEHGVRGDIFAGKKVANFTDKTTGLPVYSLYGKTRKPTPNMLMDIDVLVFDIQDIGIRPYTYISTMAYAMKAAQEYNKLFVVLDRPNPLGGLRVEGPVLEEKWKSFIGVYPIPYIHGMTVGELALLFNEEFDIHCDLLVVPMKGWRRGMTFKDTGLLWVPTSPHVPHAESVYFIAATGGIGELGTISEGVGTPMPFEVCGAPWVDGEKLATFLNRLNLPGVFFRPLTFRPYYLRFVGQVCQGVQIHITDYCRFDPMRVQIHLLTALRDLFPDQDFLGNSNRLQSFHRAMGTDEVARMLGEGKSAEEILSSWKKKLETFKRIRERYLLYSE